MEEAFTLGYLCSLWVDSFRFRTQSCSFCFWHFSISIHSCFCCWWNRDDDYRHDGSCFTRTYWEKCLKSTIYFILGVYCFVIGNDNPSDISFTWSRTLHPMDGVVSDAMGYFISSFSNTVYTDINKSTYWWKIWIAIHYGLVIQIVFNIDKFYLIVWYWIAKYWYRSTSIWTNSAKYTLDSLGKTYND